MFTPNFQSRNDLLKALMSGIKINFDDISQYESIKDFRPEFVSFRINPGIGGGEFKGIITGGHETKFGIPEELAEKAYGLALKNGAKKFGIHMHGGSNNLDKEYFKKITDRFFKIVYRIQKNLNIKFDIIDIGGGFGVPYRDKEIPLDMDSVANFVIENFKNYNLDKEKEPVLVIEPGRYLVANSTILIGTITGIKNYDKKIVGTDVGMNILIRPALYGAYHKILIANNLNQMNKENVDIVGQICENTDKIASNRPMPEVNINDKIVIFNAGAYVYSMSSNYNGILRPMELLIDKNKQIHIIRERENFNDLIKNVRIPDYLMF